MAEKILSKPENLLKISGEELGEVLAFSLKIRLENFDRRIFDWEFNDFQFWLFKLRTFRFDGFHKVTTT